MLGGPLGAALGAALGHNFDRGLTAVSQDQTLGQGDAERTQAAFFTATFSVMGHLAKADGRVSEREIILARQVMAHMNLLPEQENIAKRLFNEGKADDFPLDDALDQFRRECHRRRNLIQMFLEIQIMTALADGQFHARERELLVYICDRLGFPRALFESLVQMVQAQQRFAGERGAPQAPRASLSDAYAVLGVKESASNDEVKKAYRRLMSQHHPDKLVAKGLPQEMMELAKEKTQEIRAAYDQVKEARGM